VSVPIEQHPHLSVTKTASIPDADHDGKIDSPADDITYTITVVNDGNVTLTGVNTSDSVVGALSTHTETGGTGTNGDNILNVGETWTYTAVYDTHQSDIDNRGNVDGTADDNIHNLASITTTQGASGSASADVPIDYHPSVTLVKAGTFQDDNNDGYAEVGEHINYTFTVSNTGNVTLHNSTVTDTDGVTVAGSPIPSLAPGGSDNTTWSGTYAITSTDISNGYRDNTATVTATEASASSGNDHVLLPPAPPPPPAAMFLDISDNVGSHWVDANGNGIGDFGGGDLIQFSIDLINLSNDTLTNIMVSDLLGDAVTGNFQSPVPTSLAIGIEIGRALL
jgi:uncharacterized repeat protein (TIGR01451 family)